jgi:prevent-host-death family protein
MIDIKQDIHSLSEFKRNTGDFMRQLRETGRPVVLTINGRAELVVQDAGSYQKLLELVDRLEAIERIRRGLQELEHSEGRPAEEVFGELRRKYSLPDG